MRNDTALLYFVLVYVGTYPDICKFAWEVDKVLRMEPMKSWKARERPRVLNALV